MPDRLTSQRRISRPKHSLCVWLLLVLFSGSVSGQALLDGINVNTRRLFTTSNELPGTQGALSLNPLLLSSVARLKVQTDTYYDDVYREMDTIQAADVYRMGNVSYIEMPLGARLGGIGLEFVHTDAYAHQSNRNDEDSMIKWIDQRVSLGFGTTTWQRKLQFGGMAGFANVNEEWLPRYSVKFAWQPQTALNLALDMGRQPGYRAVEWGAESKVYPGLAEYSSRWWGASIRFGFLEQTNLMVQLRHERLGAYDSPEDKMGFVLQPEIFSRSILARAQVRPSTVNSLYFNWYSSSVTGTGEGFYDGLSFGELVSLVADNSDLEFVGTWRRSKRSMFIFTVSLFTLDSRQRWCLEPWPFAASFVTQFDSIDYSGSGRVRAERLIAEYVLSRSWAEAALQLGRVRLVPDYEMQQSRFLLIPLEPEGVISRFNIHRADFTVMGGRLSIPLGKMKVDYMFNQAIPVRIEKWEESPAKPTEEKAEIRGGSYHRLRLTLAL